MVNFGRIAFKSRYYVNSFYAAGVLCFLMAFQFFIFPYFSDSILKIFEILFLALYLLAYFLIIGYLIITTKSKDFVDWKLEDLRLSDGETDRYGNFTADALLFEKYKTLRTEFTGLNEHIHFFRDKEEFSLYFVIGYFPLVYIMLCVGQDCFMHTHLTWAVVYFLIIVASVILCIIVVWRSIEFPNNFVGQVGWTLIGILLLLYLGKSIYEKNFGDEVLGSYFEKPYYQTEYFVEVTSRQFGLKNSKLPGLIEVYNYSDEYEDGEDNFGQTKFFQFDVKSVKLREVYLENGDTIRFSFCDLELNKEIRYKDYSGSVWLIELTDEKVQ